MLRVATQAGRQHSRRISYSRPLVASNGGALDEPKNSHSRCGENAAIYLSYSTIPLGITQNTFPHIAKRNFWWGSSKKEETDTSASASSTKASSTDSSSTSTSEGNSASSPDQQSFSSSDISQDDGKSVDETLNNLFSETGDGAEGTTQAVVDGLVNGMWEPTWYNLADQAIVFVKTLHDVTGIEYGWAIVGATAILRICLFPIMVESQRHTSRMAHVQPELKLLQQKMEAKRAGLTHKDRMEISTQSKALFQRYGCKPFRAMLAPVIQIPVFMGMFFGMRKMHTIYPEEMVTGGILWVPDLTAPDPLYLLPIMSGTSMLALMEMTRSDMSQNAGNMGPLVMNFFRLTSIMMIPVLTTFDSSMVLYWTCNNVLTMAQQYALKSPAFRKQFGIWDRPKPVPGTVTEAPSLGTELSNLMKRLNGEATSDRQRIEAHNKAIEAKKRAEEMMRTAGNRRKKRS